MRKLLQNNYVTTFAANIAVVFVGMVTSILIARTLGPEGRGEIAAALIWPALLSYIGNLGLPEAVLYLASRPGASIKSIYSSMILMALLQCLIIIPIGFFLMPLLLASQNAEVVAFGRLYLLVVPVAMIGQATNSILRSQMRIKATNILQFILPGGYLVSVVLLILTTNLNVKNVVLCQLLLSGLSMIAAHLALIVHHIPIGIDVHLSVMRQLWSYGLKAHLGNISSVTNIRLDQALLAAWAPSAQLGLYVVAVNVASFVVILPRVIYYVLTPTVSRLADVETQREKFIEIFRLYWLVSLTTSALFFLLIRPLMLFIYGAEFSEAVTPTQILVIASTILGVNTVLMGAAQSLNDPLLSSRAELAASVFTIVALIIFLPSSGIVGAALISTIAYGITLSVVLDGLRSRHGFDLVELFRLDNSVQFLLNKIRPLVR